MAGTKLEPGRVLMTVIVPSFNERDTLRRAVKRLLDTELPVPFEVLVVDDGSTDGSVDTILDLVEEGPVRIVVLSRNRGKGAAIRAGLEAAHGQIATIMDADLEYDPANFAELLVPILEGDAAVAYGTRSFGAHTAYSFWYVIGNRVLGLWASFLFNAWLSDVETCLKMAPTSLWLDLGLRSNGFGIEAEVTGKLLKRGLRIFEVPIYYRARSRSEGKKLRWTDGVQALWILLRVRLFDERRSGGRLGAAGWPS
jgi:dolichol-phosphate hexosyltransferase